MSSPKEPRSTVIFEFTRQAFRHSPMQEAELTAEIIEHYDRTVDARWRKVRWHRGGDVFKDMRANCQIMRRFYNEEVRMPCDLEEAWIAALPNPWRQQCRRELAARIGRLDVKLPQVAPGGATADTGQLMKEVGEALQSLAPLFSADAGAAKADRPLAEKAINELNDVRAMCITLQQHIGNLLGDANNVHTIRMPQ